MILFFNQLEMEFCNRKFLLVSFFVYAFILPIRIICWHRHDYTLDEVGYIVDASSFITCLCVIRNEIQQRRNAIVLENSIPTPGLLPITAISITTFEDDLCPICLESESDDEIVLLKCNHKFHKACIESQLGYNRICPICRRPISPHSLEIENEKEPV